MKVEALSSLLILQLILSSGSISQSPLAVLTQTLVHSSDSTTGWSHVKGSPPQPHTRPTTVPSPGDGRKWSNLRPFWQLPTSLLPSSACLVPMTWNIGQPSSTGTHCCHWDPFPKPCTMSASKEKPLYFCASEGAGWIAELQQPNGFWRGVGSRMGHATICREACGEVLLQRWGVGDGVTMAPVYIVLRQHCDLLPRSTLERGTWK